MKLKNRVRKIAKLIRLDDGVKHSVTYTEQLSWILLLKYFETVEDEFCKDAKLAGKNYRPLLAEKYRWSNWACPKDSNGKRDSTRLKTDKELIEFVNNELFPYLEKFGSYPLPKGRNWRSIQQFRIGQIFDFVENHIRSGETLRTVLDFVDSLDLTNKARIRELSDAYEPLLQNLRGTWGVASDYYTPRPIVRAMVRGIAPKVGETVYDPTAGVFGFIEECFNYQTAPERKLTKKQLGTIQYDTYFGSEIFQTVYLMGIINLMLKGIEAPNLRCDTSFALNLNKKISESDRYDVVFSNPPFGYLDFVQLKEHIPIECDRIELAFLQHVMKSLKENGRAAFVLPDVILSGELTKHTQVFRELLENFNLHTILSLPKKTFSPHSLYKHSILFFENTGRTDEIWYFECDQRLKIGYKNLIADKHFKSFHELFHLRKNTRRSWTVPVTRIMEDYNLAPNNPLNIEPVAKPPVINIKNSDIDEKRLVEKFTEGISSSLQNNLLDLPATRKEPMLVGDLMEVNRGIRLPQGIKLTDKKNGVAYLQNSNFTDFGSIDGASLKYLPDKYCEKIKDRFIGKDDLYMSIAGLIGKSGSIQSVLESAILSDSAAKLQIKDRTQLDPEYLYFYSLTSDFNKQIKSVSTKRQPRLSLSDLSEIDVPICTLDRQEELVGFAREIDDKFHEMHSILAKNKDELLNFRTEVMDTIFDSRFGNPKLERGSNGSKRLSNPVSTGGGGVHFESDVQAYFATLMLAGGFAPGLPRYPIKEIKLQNRVDGYQTDDIIVISENEVTRTQYRLIGQIKRSVRFTKGNDTLGDVIASAWQDFNNEKLFNGQEDSLALITKPMNSTDQESVDWILGQAKHVTNSDEFYRNIRKHGFGPAKSGEKLDVLKHHLKLANDGNDVPENDIFKFLRNFQVISLDLDRKNGLALTTLQTGIMQFKKQDPALLWAGIVNTVKEYNSRAGTLTRNSFPPEVLEAFNESEQVEQIPNELLHVKSNETKGRKFSGEPRVLAILALFGAWTDNTKSDKRNPKNDKDKILKLLGMSKSKWLKNLGELCDQTDTPLIHNGQRWKVTKREEILKQCGSQLFEEDIEKFRTIAEKVLGEVDPALELPADERNMASLREKEFKHSEIFREGVSEGLAILANNSGYFSNVPPQKTQNLPAAVVGNLLKEGSWQLWASLNTLLPNLAEAAPSVFLNCVKRTLEQKKCPFEILFKLGGDGFSDRIYYSGLLWALEGLAWDKENFGRVCSYLGNLTRYDPDGRFVNRPINSLITILLPWLPQTFAKPNLRIAAVKDLLKEYPEIGWIVLIQLMPADYQRSHGSYNPKWLLKVPEDWSKQNRKKEYAEQIEKYSRLLVEQIGSDVARITNLIENSGKLLDSDFEEFCSKLQSSKLKSLPEEERTTIWEKLVWLVNHHKRYTDAHWSLPNHKLSLLESVIQDYSPSDPYLKYKLLFSGRDLDEFSGSGDNGDQEDQRVKKKQSVLREIMNEHGLQKIVELAQNVKLPDEVGRILASISDQSVDREIISNNLDSEERRINSFISSYIFERNRLVGRYWVKGVSSLVTSDERKLKFLLCLPFKRETWKLVKTWIPKQEGNYWKSVNKFLPKSKVELEYAARMFNKHGRSGAAIECLWSMLNKKMPLDKNLCVHTLLNGIKSKDLFDQIESDYTIVELIEFLQSDERVNKEDMLKITWAYLPILNSHHRTRPEILENMLASDANFYCKVIQLIYRSKHKEGVEEISDETKSMATNAWELLHNWETVPGLDQDGKLDSRKFNRWLNRVKKICTESGHIDVALQHAGMVLNYAPKGKEGFWIDKSVASALNENGHDQLRVGFRLGALDSKEAKTIDPTGGPELKKRNLFKTRAEQTDLKGYFEFGKTLREIADMYKWEADLHVSMHTPGGEFSA